MRHDAVVSWDPQREERILNWYSTHPRYADIKNYRTLQPSVGAIPNLFWGDSLTNNWPLHEFFPHHAILNRGIGGDSIYGLRIRLKEDVLDYLPRIVFMLIGINDIWDTEEDITDHIMDLAGQLKKSKIRVGVSSILPLRAPDKWDRFKFQDKILQINHRLAEACADEPAFIFLDYHTALKDETGQLAAECAQEDGTHLTFDAYRRMSAIVKPHLIKS